MSYKKTPSLSKNKLSKINFQSIWADIKEAIAGTERDFTDTPLSKAIFILAVPMVLEMIMESIFAVVDIYFITKLGADAVATVGLTESAMTIVYALGLGFAIATTALVARRIGEKKQQEAGLVAFQAIAVGLIVSIILAVPGFLFAREFLLLMGASEEMADEGFWYPAIMFGGNAVIMLLFIINAIFRSSGDAALSLRVLFVANLLNLVLDPLLIFGIGPFPELGIMGAAIATNIGRGIAVLYQFYILFRGNHRIKLYLTSIRIRITIMHKLIRISGGGIFQYLIATLSWLFLMRIISVFGSDVLAGYTIAIRIVIFTLLPAWGLSNAASTLVGQNLGAKRPDRAEQSVWITAYANMAFMFIQGLILFLIPTFLMSLFTDDLVIIDHGVTSLRIIAIGFVFYGLGMVLVQGINGSGDTNTPTWINFISFWVIELPSAYFMAIVLDWGLAGACIAIVVGEAMLSLLSLYVFRKGKWKLREV